MAKPFFLTVLGFFSILFLCSCASVSQKQSAQVSRAVYATQDAIAAGRMDLAKAYNAQATRLLPPPAKRQAIKPLETQGKRYVVLPVEFIGTPALAIGSTALSTLATADKALGRQFSAEQKALAKVSKDTDSVVAAKERIVAKAEEKAIVARSTLAWRLGLLAKGLALGAVLFGVCYFFPPAIPVLVSLLKTALGLLHWLWVAFLALFKKGGHNG